MGARGGLRVRERRALRHPPVGQLRSRAGIKICPGVIEWRGEAGRRHGAVLDTPSNEAHRSGSLVSSRGRRVLILSAAYDGVTT